MKIELLISDDAETMVYEKFLQNMLQIKRNRLYEDMLKLNKEYEKFLNNDKASVQNVRIYLQHCETDAIEIEKIVDELNDNY